MAEKLWWETHALLLGKLTGDLLTLELSARLVVATREVGGDLKNTRPPLPQLKEGDFVGITPISNSSDMTWALDKYNKCVRRQHPELMVDTKAIVFLRDALAHGRAFGVSDPTSGPHLRLLKFSKDTHDGRAQVTLRVDMTKEWFDSKAQLLSDAVSKVAKALDFEEKELGSYSDSDASSASKASATQRDDIGFKKLTVDNWLQADPLFLKTAPISALDALQMAVTLNGADLSLPEAFVPPDGWLQAAYKPTLHNGVSKDVRRLFEAARGIFVYGYCYYPLCSLAAEQVVRVLETAVSSRCRGPGSPKEKASFNDKIEWLVKNELLSAQDRTGLHALRTLRNETSHPKHQMLVVPHIVGELFMGVAEYINKLFEKDGGED